VAGSYRVICIYGPDGSGKSTICNELVRVLNQKGIKATYRWMRFNHITSKVVNGIGRLTGLSEKVRYNGNVVVGYHHYNRSSALSWLYIYSTITDLFLVYPFKIVWPMLTGKVIVIDRFIYDILVDLMVDTGIDNLYKKWPIRILKKLLPVDSACFFFEVDIDTIRTRRPDTMHDINYRKKYDLYKNLSKEFALDTIDNNLPIEVAVNTILEKIKR